MDLNDDEIGEAIEEEEDVEGEEEEDVAMDDQIEEEFEENMRALQNTGIDNLDDDDASDVDDFRIRNTDKIILVAQTDEDFSCLEVHVYDEDSGSLYVHHDLTLPAFPLCVEWVGCNETVIGNYSTKGSSNYVAIGTFLPGIEIWNLDVLDALEPNIILGGQDTTSRKKTGKNYKNQTIFVKDSHEDAVMCLSWNQHHPSLIASGSADKTIKLWDISTSTCAITYKHHNDKIQVVKWNPIESSILLCGSFDKTISVFDSKTAPSSNNISIFNVTADVEDCCWDSNSPPNFFVATEDGIVSYFDVRCPGKPPIYSFQAHQQSVSALSQSTNLSSLLATASSDKSVKLWDVSDLSTNNQPKLLAHKPMTAGDLYACSFCPDDPFLLATGGSEGSLALWDTIENAVVDEVMSSRVVESTTHTVRKEIITSSPTPPMKTVTTPPMNPNESMKKEKKKRKKKKKSIKQ